MKLLPICFAFVMLGVSMSSAEVFWFEAEAFDEEKSNPIFNEQGLNVEWAIKEDTTQDIKFGMESFGNMYVIPSGANRDTVEAAAGLVYILPDVEKTTGWQLWIRCVMPTGGSDSFFHQLSDDGGDDWGPATAAHGGAQWQEYLWKSWSIGALRKGEGNALRIAERENNYKLDVICLRNDGGAPSDEEYQAYLDALPEPGGFAVDARGKLTGTWGKIKSDAPR